MGNKQGANNRENLYGPNYHKQLGSRGGNALWNRIKRENPLILRKNK
jgi:hypothetical protein